MSSRSNIARRVVLFVVAAVVAFVLAACPGPTFVVQQYGGPQRPQETIATLRVNGREPVRLLFLDDQDVAAPLEEDSRLHIELLPARHTVVVGNANAPKERYAPISFQAEPGKVYRVAFATGAAGAEPRMYEVDRSKDTSIRDVTQSPAEAVPPRPLAPPAPPAPPPAVEDAGAPAASADAG